jgi:hypothetical protein
MAKAYSPPAKAHMIRRIAAVAMLAFATSPIASHAQIYDNGAPNAVDGYGMSGSVLADNFTIANDFTVSAIRFWGFSPTSTSTYSGSVTWAVYLDASGMPGTQLFTGVAAPVGVNQGPLAFGGRDQYQFDFAANFGLTAGTYWLSLYTGPAPGGGGVFNWQSTGDRNNGSLYIDVPNDPGHWVDVEGDLAFQLYGQTESVSVVPEPSTYALFATGLIAIGLVRRRRRA